MRRLALVTAVLVLLAGCENGGGKQVKPAQADIQVVHVSVDGRTVPCVIGGQHETFSMAISCDWSQR